MELLAVLSTIILVATIATLILAVASYILYKVRERRGAAQSSRTAPQPYLLTAPSIAAPHHPPALLPAAKDKDDLPQFDLQPAPAWSEESNAPPVFSFGDGVSFDGYSGDGFDAPRITTPSPSVQNIEDQELEWL